MLQKLALALSEISEQHIAEAAVAKKRHRRVWIRAIAAVLAVVLLWNMPYIPMAVNVKAVALSEGSRGVKRPAHPEFGDWDGYFGAIDLREETAAQALDALTPFFCSSTQAYIADSDGNQVWSPVNAYIALATLAEVTDGESRQQILTALNTPDLDTLRTQVGAVWEEVFMDDGNEISVLANSLWLDENVSYVQEAMDNVAYYHYTDIYQTDLSKPKAGKALQTWLNNNTGGLLTKQAGAAEFPPEAVLTLASTVYLQAKWGDDFSAELNSDGIFHAPDGDVEVTYMNKKEAMMDYYWGESFGAVNLYLKNGCEMWFFLPDEGKTVADVLASAEYLDMLNLPWAMETDYSKYMKVNLSVPKFDITSSGDIKDMLQGMGITDVFGPQASDFTAIISDAPVCVTAVNQAARVIIDEQGVKAASYIEIPGAGAGMPPEEVIDFVLDRPFLFVISDSSGIPLFTGVVNEPS